MRNIFRLIEKSSDFCYDFWGTKICNILKLSGLWGVIVILFGSLFSSNTTQWVGIVMCSGFVLILTIMALYFVLVFIFLTIYGLLAHTEKVLFGKNKIFVD